VIDLEAKPRHDASRHDLYQEATAVYGAALGRLARSYEADPDKRQDLLQEIHLGVWRSLERFRGQCSLRTWVYRVAHNVATSHVISHRRQSSRQWVTLDVLDVTPAHDDAEAIDRELMLHELHALIHQLDPPDRQLMLLYLEGLDAASIGEITGLSPSNVATRIHRLKRVIARRVRLGGQHER